MFKAGDLIIYENTGVCRVSAIQARKFPGTGKDRQYYVIKPLYQNCIIYVPVGSTKVFMRPIMTKTEAEQLIDMIPDIRAEAACSRFVRQLSDNYEALLQTHSCSDLIELTKSLYIKKKNAEQHNRKLGLVDERFLKRAEELLFGELAASLGMTRDEVPDYIAARVPS